MSEDQKTNKVGGDEPLTSADRDLLEDETAGGLRDRAAKAERFWEDAVRDNKKVRASRVVVFEGTAEWVRDQIRRSWPTGVRSIHGDHEENRIITYTDPPKILPADGEGR